MYARSLLIAILGLALLSVQVRAQPANGAPSVETRSDSLVPRAALLRSAILPGWGQLYNGKPYKALFFALSAILASIDAYVDAHLAHFADRWDVHAGPDGSRFTLYIDLPSKED